MNTGEERKFGADCEAEPLELVTPCWHWLAAQLSKFDVACFQGPADGTLGELTSGSTLLSALFATRIESEPHPLRSRCARVENALRI